MLARLIVYTLTIFVSHSFGSAGNNFQKLNKGFHKRENPTVATDYGTWVGLSESGIDSFRGIPFAQPPLGNLRFAAPQPPNISYGVFAAQNWGSSCVQTTGTSNNFAGVVQNALQTINQYLGIPEDVGSEDCLTINVWRPSGATGPLPIIFFIHGGGFVNGNSRLNGENLVNKSMELGQPIIVVSANYRLNGFGFLAGRQVKPGGGDINAGMLDQRLALRGIQKYISLFGGNPKQVTILGGSAGSISVGYHLVANNGNNEGLFHAAIMHSGSPLPSLGTDGGQDIYDQIVSVSRCNKADSYKCLQHLPVNELRTAMETLPSISAYTGLHLPFKPRVDGEFISADAQDLLLQGKYAKVPIIAGNCYDDGTSLSIGGFNATTTADVAAWLKAIFPNIQQSQVDIILRLYPNDVTAGSPYDTWIFNNVSGQNKRVASLGGDFIMQAPRRFLLDVVRKTQNVWSYQSRALKITPIFGSFHGSDFLFLLDLFPLNPDLTDEFQSRWINFVNHFNPNPKSGKFINWPTYGEARNQLQFSDFLTTLQIDNFRRDGIAYFNSIRKVLAF